MPPNLYDPFVDPKFKTLEEIHQYFFTSFGAHYQQKAAINKPDISLLDLSKHGTYPTVSTWTEEESARNLDLNTAIRSDMALFAPPMQLEIKAQVERALYDEKLAATILPDLELVFQVGEESPWHMPWGYIKTALRYREEIAQGKQLRKLDFTVIPKAHHVVSPCRNQLLS